LTGPALANPIGVLRNWAAQPVRNGVDVRAGPPFRERVPWFGGNLQNSAKRLRGAPAGPGGRRGTVLHQLKITVRRGLAAALKEFEGLQPQPHNG
jgi:hypothetical protein